jgi:hypothetical protein
MIDGPLIVGVLLRMATAFLIFGGAVVVGETAFYLLHAALVRRGPRPRPDEWRRSRLDSFLWGGLATACLMLGLLDRSNPNAGAIVVGSGAVMLWAAYRAVHAANWRLWASDEGLQVRDVLGRIGRLVPWSEVVEVSLAPKSQRLDFRLLSGRTVQVAGRATTRVGGVERTILELLALAERHQVRGAGDLIAELLGPARSGDPEEVDDEEQADEDEDRGRSMTR